MIQSKLLQKYPELIHGFGEKIDTWKTLGIAQSLVATVSQIHSDKVVTVTKPINHSLKADGMITKEEIYLAVVTADCVPLFLYVPTSKYIAAIHAGWKGIINNVIINAVKKLKFLGTAPTDIVAAIGPSIGKCCYNVDKTRAKFFKRKFPLSNDIVDKRNNNWFLDIGLACFNQLINLGLKPNAIDRLDMCTFCNKRFFSARRDGKQVKRAINIIGVKSNFTN